MDPFHKPGDFEIVMEVSDSEKLSGPVVQKPPSGADLEFEFRVLADEKISRNSPRLCQIRRISAKQSIPMPIRSH